MGLKLLLKLDIGEKCLIEALETTPMTNVLAAMSTLLYKFFKQENLVQICNIIDECRNQTPIFKQQWNNGSISKRKDIRDTTQKKIIEEFTKMDKNKLNPRVFKTSERIYKKLVKDMDVLLKELYNLGDEDELIPIISEVY